jgi:predicted nucleic acid-binding protein
LLITGDNDLLTLKKFMKTDMVTPREFWNRLRK